MEFFRLNKKKVIVFITAVIILLVLVFASYRFGGPWGRNYEGDDIPYRALKNAQSIIKPAADKAAQSILDRTLNNTGYMRWRRYSGELDMLLEEADVLTGGENEVLVALSLPPQEGIIALYKREGGRLKYSGRIPSLLPVKGIETLDNARIENRLLVVDQFQDEMLGAFFNAAYRDIFIWRDGHFDRVLGLLTDYNAYWNQAWDGVKEDPHWLWLNQKSEVEYADRGETVRIRHIQSLLMSTVTGFQNIPDQRDFAVRYFRMVKEDYRWNSDWGLYIMGEYTDNLTGERVALLEDYRTNVSSFIRGTGFEMVKVMDRDGKISIIPAQRIE
jgi:hypothetical protein